jgi:hypothetical protein
MNMSILRASESPPQSACSRPRPGRSEMTAGGRGVS